MRTTDELDYRARWQRIPEPILRVSHHNPLVHRIITQFAIGEIVTWEEALCQMVVGMARNWDEQQKRAFQQMMASMPPIVIAKENFK